MSTHTSDVIVLGAGLIGSSCALAIADRGLQVMLIDEPRAGMASVAAAGLLAPSIDPADGPAQRFTIASRDAYPDYLADLRERTGRDVPLDRSGVLQVALSPRGVKGLRGVMPMTSTWLDAGELARLEPALAHAAGAVLNLHDGYVDNVALHAALERALELSARVQRRDEAAVRVDFCGGGPAVVELRGGDRVEAMHVVLAAGTWSARLAGLPRVLPIEPVRGQVVSFTAPATRLRRAAFGPTGYLVPRADRVLVGSTVEHVGFDAGVTESAAARLRATAGDILPPLAGALPVAHWSGLRPMTPDGQPILGADPEEPRLTYACGHSRNGILGTPLTGACVASLILGEPVVHDLSAFGAGRFVGLRAE